MWLTSRIWDEQVFVTDNTTTISCGFSPRIETKKWVTHLICTWHDIVSCINEVRFSCIYGMTHSYANWLTHDCQWWDITMVIIIMHDDVTWLTHNVTWLPHGVTWLTHSQSPWLIRVWNDSIEVIIRDFTHSGLWAVRCNLPPTILSESHHVWMSHITYAWVMYLPAFLYHPFALFMVYSLCDRIHPRCDTAHTRCDMTHSQRDMTHSQCDMTHWWCDMIHSLCDTAHSSCGMTYSHCDMTHSQCDMTQSHCDMTDLQCDMSHSQCVTWLTHSVTWLTHSPSPWLIHIVTWLTHHVTWLKMWHDSLIVWHDVTWLTHNVTWLNHLPTPWLTHNVTWLNHLPTPWLTHNVTRLTHRITGLTQDSTRGDPNAQFYHPFAISFSPDGKYLGDTHLHFSYMNSTYFHIQYMVI